MSILERVYKELEKQNIKPIRLCEHLGISTGQLSTWKKRGTEPKAVYIKPIAEFLGVSERYLLTGEEDNRNSDKYVKDDYQDDELTEYLDELHKRPEMKMLFKVAKKATKEDVEKAVKIIEMFKGTPSDGDDI